MSSILEAVAGSTGRRLAPGERLGLWVALLLFAVLLALPGLTESYGLSVVRDILIFGLFALSLDYLWGKTGLLSFGHATFFGLGCYGMAVVTIKFGLDPAYAPWLGVLGGLMLAAIVALAVGYFLIFGGVRGAYFTIVTLALTLIAQHIAIGWSDVTGGDSGLIGVPPLSVEALGITVTFFDSKLYYLALCVGALSLAALWFICRGRYGLVLTAIQDNELRAQTLGHNTSFHILVVFVVSAMLASIAGAIYVTGTGFVAPDMIGLLLSTEVIMWVAVGGRGTLIGPFIGTFVVFRLQQEISSIDTKLWPLFIGAFFIAMVFLFPDGIMTVVRRAQALLRRYQARPGHD
jgi:branched-chain amino acid transport system permease protein